MPLREVVRPAATGLADALLRGRRGLIRARWQMHTKLGLAVPYRPSAPGNWSYAIAPRDQPASTGPGLGLPVPPPALWGDYGSTEQQYLASGQRDAENLCRALASISEDATPPARILDFGCNAGRMTRWLPLAGTSHAEIWGVDVDADVIRWCERNLSPPFKFAVTTVVPHLPFPDGYFDLVVCGSVFTHIDDLATAWILELGRITRAGGAMYTTIHDQHTVELLASRYRTSWLATYTRSRREYSRYLGGPWSEICLGRFADSQVFFTVDAFKERLSAAYEVHAVHRETYGYQTAIVSTRRQWR